MKRVARFLLTIASTLVLAAAGPFASTAGAATGAWEPKTPIDFVVMAGKGGGADSMARLMQAIAEKYVLSPQPLVPTNVPGASGEEALMHLKNKAGDDHTLMVTLNSFYTTPLRRPGLDVDITAFAPVARMAEDTFLLWVHSESGIDNLVYFMQRSIVGPPGMSPEAAAFYQDMFRKIYESDEWQRYMQDKSMYAPYIAGNELKAYWIRERAVHDAILRQVGEI